MAVGKRFLVYSQNELVLGALKEQLTALPETKGYAEAREENDCILQAGEDFFDAIIIDEAAELAPKIRRAGFTRPILVLGAKEQEEERQEDVNITDFVPKPLRFVSFLARLYRALAGTEGKEEKSFIIAGKISFNPKTREVEIMAGEAKQILTEKEAEILTYLYHAKGKPVDRDVLLKEVWGYNSEVATHTLETHIYRLRQKIDTDEKAPVIIAVDGGYSLA